MLQHELELKIEGLARFYACLNCLLLMLSCENEDVAFEVTLISSLRSVFYVGELSTS